MATMEERLRAADEQAERLLKGKEETPEEASSEDATKEKPKDFEHKYSVLKGKYDKEVPRMHQEIQAMRQALAEKEEEIKTLSTRSTLQDDGARPIELEQPPEVKEFLEEYPDVAKGVDKFIEYKLKASATKETPKEKKAEPKSAPEKATWTEQMYVALTAKSPNWQKINHDPEFLGWLTGKDRYARKTRQELLGEAFAAGDIDVVGNLFNDYEAFYMKSAEDTTESEDVSPPKGRSPELPSEGDKGFVTRSEIRKFYQDLSQGRYVGKEKEAQKIEARINHAIANRRILEK